MPVPALYRGPDGLRLLVREMPWLGRPRLFRFDFVAGPGLRGTVVMDFPEPDDQAYELARRVALPHAPPIRMVNDRKRPSLIQWLGVDLGRAGSGEVLLRLTAAGRVSEFTFQVTQPRVAGPRRAAVTCAPELHPRSRALD